MVFNGPIIPPVILVWELGAMIFNGLIIPPVILVWELGAMVLNGLILPPVLLVWYLGAMIFNGIILLYHTQITPPPQYRAESRTLKDVLIFISFTASVFFRKVCCLMVLSIVSHTSDLGSIPVEPNVYLFEQIIRLLQHQRHHHFL